MNRVGRWSAQQWNAISPYLDQALDVEASQRESWLAKLAASDSTLADELRALLAIHDANHAAQFLEHSPLNPRVEPVAGLKVGAYTLESLLGSGGMGSVWRARRSDGRFDAQVAIKILNPLAMGAEGAEQVRREAGLLAQQTHPNIARLFDAGICDNGQPYLILEYVEGVRIDEYSNRRELPPEARLMLLLPVIDAVAHAHGHRIVHRDLKPSNVLVTADGVAKLLDFGVAALISISASLPIAASLAKTGSLSKTGPLEAGVSQTHSSGMTPAFAAPEQIRGEPVTPASDVYALGVLLHVLVTNQHPFGADTKTHTQLIRAVLTDDAMPASESMASSSSKRWVRGDLDSIIAKAIAREPEHRYATAAELAADLRRLLSHRPVQARSNSWLRRASMFVRRNRRWGPSVLGALLLSVAVIVAGAVWLQSKNPKPAALPPAHSVATGQHR